MSKVPVNITVDKELLEEFRKLCENGDIKVSTKINTLIRDWLDNQKNNKK